MATGIKTAGGGKNRIKVSDKVRDYGNDPYFVKKAKASKAFLEKNGFPKELGLSGRGPRKKGNF
jgi:hypothetical protein